MDALIASLPTVSNSELLIMYNENEYNAITMAQVIAVKEKGWIPKYLGRIYHTNNSYSITWIEYASVGVEINKTNFPDENFREYLKTQTYYGADGILTDEEISAIISMSVYNMQISNLKGIEHFTALTNLSCGDNQLTSLDVSNNTALRSLLCNNNQLTILDVSKNTALTSLYCYNNQLTSLDVSKNTALISLYCYNNQLTSLDVSNTALTYLPCYSNQIRGEAMDALVASLPSTENGSLNIIYNENEGNEMTAAQVAAAKAKGWIPQYRNGSKWTEYAGVPVEFKLTYMVDGVEYKSYDVEYGAIITPETNPEKETYRFLGWSEIPETMPSHDVTVTGAFERYFTVGNVARLVSFVINGNATSDEVELYDQNTDEELNIGDIILVVKWILNNDNSGPSNSRTRSYNVPDWTQYTAAQFDVRTTADTNIREIRLVKGMEQTHQMMYQQKDAYTYTVVVYSLSNQLMKPENGNIVEITTDKNTLNGVSIENVIVALPTGETESYNGAHLSTNILQIEGEEGPAVVYDLKGNRQNGTKGLKKGVYIVNGKKVIVK